MMTAEKQALIMHALAETRLTRIQLSAITGLTEHQLADVIPLMIAEGLIDYTTHRTQRSGAIRLYGKVTS